MTLTKSEVVHQIDMNENTAFPGWDIGNEVTVSSNCLARFVTGAVVLTPTPTGTPTFALNVETGIGAGEYADVVPAEVPAGLGGSIKIPFFTIIECGRKYYFSRTTPGASTVNIAIYSTYDLL